MVIVVCTIYDIFKHCPVSEYELISIRTLYMQVNTVRVRVCVCVCVCVPHGLVEAVRMPSSTSMYLHNGTWKYQHHSLSHVIRETSNVLSKAHCFIIYLK